MIVWKVFYAIIWTEVILIDATYWTLSLEMMKKTDTGFKNLYRMFAMVFIPAIMMTLAYAFVYWRLEKAMTEGKIRTGQGFRSRLGSGKCAAILKIGTLVFVILFVVA